MNNNRSFTCGTTNFYLVWKLDDSELNKNIQTIDIGNVGIPISFTYAEIKTDIDNCVQQTEEYYNQERTETFKIPQGGPFGRKITYPDSIIPAIQLSKEQKLKIKACLSQFIEELDDNLFLNEE